MLAYRYHAVDGARSPVVVAAVWTGLVGVLDVLLLAGLVRPQLAIALVAALPVIFAVIWIVGSQRGVASRATT
jgi:hypothetical protein